MKTISTCGDLGDVIYLLNIIRQIPDGPHTLCLRPSGATKAKGPEGVRRLYNNIAPLALAQPYIKDVEIIAPSDEVYWASEGFRMASYVHGQTLMQAHLNHLIKTHGIGRDFNSNVAWLNVEPSTISKGRVIVNRTSRYRNPWFEWPMVVEAYRHRILFVGLEHEWREFIGVNGYVDFAPTSNMLEVAQIIAGSELFIGNQSCANACAEGLKHNLIQETSMQFPDCVFNRPNAKHIVDGKMTLPDVDGSGEKHVESRAITWKNYKINHVPQISNNRMGWFYQHENIMVNESHFEFAVRKVKKLTGWDDEKCEREIVQFTVALNPEWFERRIKKPQFDAARHALRNAGYTEHPIL